MHLIAWVLLGAMGVPAFAARQVTVAGLEDELPKALKEPDEWLAEKLSKLELTERFPSADFPRLLAGLPGDKSREALRVLVDMSAFLDPPAAQIPATPAPDEAGQREIMARVVEYVSRTNHKLPNFFATRTTTRFEDWPQGLPEGSEVAGRHIPPRMVGTSKAVVTYRNGAEVETSSTRHARKKAQTDTGLTSWGEFGPTLARVLVDASKSTAAWKRWERAEDKVLAVFRFTVPMNNSSYQVKFCCYSQGSLLMAIDRKSAYHGEIAVNPEDGTVVSLRLIADLDQGEIVAMLGEAMAGTPLSRADTLIEYGPVEIAGKTYICPKRSVAISRARVSVRVRIKTGSTAPRPHPDDHYEPGPARTYINDVSFTDYHVFRSESRIIFDGTR